MDMKELIEGLTDILFDLCPNCSLNENEHKIVDEIIERLMVYEELKKKRLEAFVERKAKKR